MLIWRFPVGPIDLLISLKWRKYSQHCFRGYGNSHEPNWLESTKVILSYLNTIYFHHIIKKKWIPFSWNISQSFLWFSIEFAWEIILVRTYYVFYCNIFIFTHDCVQQSQFTQLTINTHNQWSAHLIFARCHNWHSEI